MCQNSILDVKVGSHSHAIQAWEHHIHVTTASLTEKFTLECKLNLGCPPVSREQAWYGKFKHSAV